MYFFNFFEGRGGYHFAIFIPYNGGIRGKEGFLLDQKLLNKIKSEFISGKKTLREAAKEHKISYSTLSKVSHEEKWKEIKENCAKISEKKVAELTKEKCTRDIEQFYRIGNELLDNAETLIKNIKTADDLVKCSNAMSKIKDVLDLKSNEDREEQKARIEKLRKDAQIESQGDTTVTVRFEEDISKWSK